MDQLEQGLLQNGFAILRGFLSDDIVSLLRQEVSRLDDRGLLKPAATGRGLQTKVRTDIRGDRIFWLDSSHFLMEKFDSIRVFLNQTFYLGLNSFECHFAIYPPGSFYQKHLDRHRDSDARVVSVVLYLNEQWLESDGGSLNLYARDQHDLLAAKIVPQGGTLACFMSGEIWHEVTVTTRPRYTITGWFRR